MKTQILLFRGFCALLICTCILSCKKDNNKKAPACRIVAATVTDDATTTTINITYNNQNKISSLSTSGSTPINKVFTYNGNTIIVNTTTSAGAFYGRDSVTIDNMGRPLNIRHFYNQAGTSWHNSAYEYSGDDMLKFMQKYESDNIPDTYTVNSAAGNVVYFGNSGNSTSLEYYDKTVQPGDYLQFTTLTDLGVSIYPQKNLVKKIDSGLGNYTDLSYEFDAEGKITKVALVSGGYGITFAYQYQCD